MDDRAWELHRHLRASEVNFKCSDIREAKHSTLQQHQRYTRHAGDITPPSVALHTALIHLDSKNSCVRMLFLYFSSAFNTNIPQQLIKKHFSLKTSLGNLVLDFLTERPQNVKVDNNTKTITLSTGAPQRVCAQLATLYSAERRLVVGRLVHNQPTTSSNNIIKFADDTTMVGLITNNRRG